jgi:hypothetical protein
VLIEYARSPGPANFWEGLPTAMMTKGPQLALDFSGVGKSARFYRTMHLP